MGAETTNPYEGMDPDNINYVHSVNYDEMHDLLHKLPPGWKRIDASELSPNQPPYVHEPSGQTSWRNPNFDKVMSVADKYHQQQGKRNVADTDASSKQVKKLRLMLQAGAPLGAVEQKARLDGIDMALVLSPSEEKKEDSNDAKAAVNDIDEEKEAVVAIPEILVKKYKRMIKCGVPMDRVQQVSTSKAPKRGEVVTCAGLVECLHMLHSPSTHSLISVGRC